MEEAPQKTPFQRLVDDRRSELAATLTAILRESRGLVWEVGSGHGHFLTSYAETHPAKICIGIDLVGERVARALRKRERARAGNLHFLRADARLFLEVMPPGASLSEIFILFPDPWPKLRHRKHRILQPEFLRAAARLAEPDAILCFRTDYAPYFAEVEAMIDPQFGWRRVDEPWPFEFETVFQRRAPKFYSLVARRATRV